MRCPHCKAPIAPPPRGPTGPLRCLDCGALVGPDAGPPAEDSDSSPAKHSYQTPYGRIVGRLQESGRWALASQVAGVDDPQRLTNLLRNLLGSLAGVESEALARSHSVDEEKRQCLWGLPVRPELAPLSRLRPPLPPPDVERLIRRIAPALDRIHRIGLGSFDLAPQVIFVQPGLNAAVVVPTPWLASLARLSPDPVAGMPFVAPELGSADAHPDPARADVYALGALAWYLLTGTSRKEDPTRLPSQVSPDLARWDAFVDGCCRTRPERRFGAAGAALEALAPAPAAGGKPASIPSNGPATATPAPTATAKPPRKRRRWSPVVVALLCLLAVGLLAAYLRRDRLSDLLPGAGGLLSPHRRGFADTIIRYEDRSYEGAEWKQVQDAEAMQAVVGGRMEPSGVAGWDARSFWIVGHAVVDPNISERAIVAVRYRNGTWVNQAVIKREGGDYTSQRLEDDDSLLLADYSNYDGERKNWRLYRVNTAGVVDFQMPEYSNQGDDEIAVVAGDLTYMYASYIEDSSDQGLTVKLSGNDLTELEQDKHKAAYVHREDNVPLKDYPTSNIRLVLSYERGRALGVVWPRTLADSHEIKLITFQDGIWYALQDLNLPSVNFDERHLYDMWAVPEGDGSFFVVLTGPEGFVLQLRTSQGAIEQRLPVASEPTSMKLIRAWGTSPQKYWVMDSHGTVWERTPDRWRIVVRGLHDSDVEFTTAWVSPEGVVIALTREAIYRLE